MALCWNPTARWQAQEERQLQEAAGVGLDECCARNLSHEDMKGIGKWWKNWWFKSKETMENIVKYRTMMKHGALSTHFFFEPFIILNPGNHLDLIKKSWIWWSNTFCCFFGRTLWIIKPSKFYRYIFWRNSDVIGCRKLKDSPSSCGYWIVGNMKYWTMGFRWFLLNVQTNSYWNQPTNSINQRAWVMMILSLFFMCFMYKNVAYHHLFRWL